MACILLAGIVGKLAYDRRQRLARTIGVIELAASILLDHPPLFILCLALIATFVIFTAPFVSILSRLLSIGLASPEGWHPTHHSTILAGFVAFVWLWTLGVLRGVQRMTVAGVIGHWFFLGTNLRHPHLQNWSWTLLLEQEVLH